MRHVEELPIELGPNASQRRQQIVPNTIPRVVAQRVRWIFDPLHAVLLGIRGDVLARKRNQRPRNPSVRIERGKSSRPGIAHDAHEDRFDLIRLRVGGRDVCTMVSGHTPQKAPACIAECFFAQHIVTAVSLCPQSFDYLNRQIAASPSDERTRGGRGGTGAVVEGRNQQTVARHHGGRGVEQGHRVETARNGQHDVAQRIECVAHGATNGVGLAHT